MSPSMMKWIGAGCLAVCAVLLFVAWERYEDNANKVEAIGGMLGSSPLGGMMKGLTGGAGLEPGMPTSTKYCLAFAVVFGVGGIGFLVAGMRSQPNGGAHSGQPKALAGDVDAPR